MKYYCCCYFLFVCYVSLMVSTWFKKDITSVMVTTNIVVTTININSIRGIFKTQLTIFFPKAVNYFHKNAPS